RRPRRIRARNAGSTRSAALCSRDGNLERGATYCCRLCSYRSRTATKQCERSALGNWKHALLSQDHRSAGRPLSASERKVVNELLARAEFRKVFAKYRMINLFPPDASYQALGIVPADGK